MKADYRDEIFLPLRPPPDTLCHAGVELVTHPVAAAEIEPSRPDQANGGGVESSTSEGASGGVVEAGPSGNESPSLLQTLNQNTNYEDVPVGDVLQEVVVTHGVDGGKLLPHPSNPGEEGPSNNPGDGGFFCRATYW